MIALGGVIGTGLFLGSGLIIHQAGPGGAILSFIIGGLLMYLVMLCLGELAVAMPTAGSFQEYATKYIGPSTGFMIGWLYWFSWACTIGLEFTSAGILLQRWFPDIPVWLWCLAFSVILFAVNAISARSFAETEFWFSAIKVAAILLFIIIGIGAIFGMIHLKDGEPAPLFRHLTDHGGLFPNGVFAILLTMVTVNFSFQGTELVGIAAGESESPEKHCLVLYEILFGERWSFRFIHCGSGRASSVADSRHCRQPVCRRAGQGRYTICGRYHEFYHHHSRLICSKLWIICIITYALVAFERRERT